MPPIIEANKYRIAAAIIVFLMAIGIRYSFPAINEYYYGADEGHYLAFANTVKDKGFFDGIYHSAETYAKTPNSFIWPNPLRVFYIFLSGTFIRFCDGMVGLSYLSLFSYVLMVVLSYRFVEKHFGGMHALLLTVLLAVSPLGLGVSSRALMDATSYLMIIASIITFVNYLIAPNKGKLALFIGVYILCILTKEVTCTIFPFFLAVWLFNYLSNKDGFPLLDLLLITIVVPICTFLVYISLLGIDNFFSIAKALQNGTKILEVHKYYAIYNRGPWYKYIIDFTILSPYVFLLSLVGLGYYIQAKAMNKIRFAWIAVIALGYFLVVCYISKNVRYVIPMDWLIRLTVALMMPLALDSYEGLQKIKGYILFFSLFLLAGYDLSTFNQLFIVKKVYDPITYNLLDAGGVMPIWDYAKEIKDTVSIDAHSIPPQANTTGTPLVSTPQNDSIKIWTANGIASYNKGDYNACIVFNQKVLQVDSTNADAYNNIGASYNQLRDYRNAIKACEQAVHFKPDYQLAKNNLEWAKSQLK